MTAVRVTDLSVARKFIELRESASKRNIQFNLSIKKVKQLLSKTKCHYTGIPFADSRVSQDLARSIDRVDNTKGYTDDNTVAASVIFNSMKSNLTLEQVMKVIKSVAKADGKAVKITKAKRTKAVKLKVLKVA